MSSKIAIYPGSFDPFTLGHQDIVVKSLQIFDQIIIAIAEDNLKNSIFTTEERKEIIEHEVSLLQNHDKILKVEVFKGLLVDYVNNNKANVIIRGLRAISDFEYEFQLSCMNQRLSPNIQTIFLPASEDTHFISSKMVKEVSRLGGDVSKVVSQNVKSQLSKKFQPS